jgi:TonB family protein
MEPEFHLKNQTFRDDPAPQELVLPKVYPPEQKGSAKFFASSIALHVLLATAAATASIFAYEKKATETVEIQIVDPGASTSPTLPVEAKAPAPVAPQLPEEEETPPTKEDVAAPPPLPPIRTAPPPAPPSQKMAQPKAAKPAPAPKAVAETPVQKQASFKPAPVQTFKTESPVIIPDSVDDINAPDLDESAAKTPVAAKIDDEELGKDFNKVDEAQHKQVVAVAKDLDSQTNEAMSETDGLANQLNQENEAEAEKIAAYNAARRARDAQAVAAAQASERAAAARAAQEAAAAKAAQEAATAEAAARARAQAEQTGSGNGVGNGSDNGVRALEQLRQKPGNPIPRYDQQEQLRGDQGEVIFHAFVNEDGTLSNFQMIKSSGYRNLDAKTLKALKQWRFYPGQAGMVELPFKWDLKGEARLMPTLLRRK